MAIHNLIVLHAIATDAIHTCFATARKDFHVSVTLWRSTSLQATPRPQNPSWRSPLHHGPWSSLLLHSPSPPLLHVPDPSMFLAHLCSTVQVHHCITMHGFSHCATAQVCHCFMVQAHRFAMIQVQFLFTGLALHLSLKTTSTPPPHRTLCLCFGWVCF